MLRPNGSNQRPSAGGQAPQAPQAPMGGGGFGMPQQPMPLNPAGGMISPVSPGMPGTQGSGSMDTGGLDANPGGGFGMPAPAPLPPVTNNTYNTSRTYNTSNRTNNMFDQRKSTTNIDNSMTQQGQRMQRKTKAQLNPFQTISPEMDQKMIGDPSNPLAQLRIMRGR
jgi:hypothetical protein